MDQELLTFSEHLSSFTPLIDGSCYSIFSFMCIVCRALFVLLYFFFWSLCCLFFVDIQILITPLVSSNSSFVDRCSSFCTFSFGHCVVCFS